MPKASAELANALVNAFGAGGWAAGSIVGADGEGVACVAWSPNCNLYRSGTSRSCCLELLNEQLGQSESSNVRRSGETEAIRAGGPNLSLLVRGVGVQV